MSRTDRISVTKAQKRHLSMMTRKGPKDKQQAARPSTAHKSEAEELWESLVSPAGYILAVSYPVLALSTGVRAVFQLFFRTDIVDYSPVLLSALAALCYLVATVGFAYRRRWTWWLSVGVLGFETVMTLAIGIWSLIEPDVVGRTVWRRFGEDYGYFPLFQPLIGLVWLVWPQTMQAYGIRLRNRDAHSVAQTAAGPASGMDSAATVRDLEPPQ